MNQKHIVIAQCWERDDIPDGCTLHIDEPARLAFVDRQEETFRYASVDDRPMPCGPPFPLEVDDTTFRRVKESLDGVEFEYEDTGLPG